MNHRGLPLVAAIGTLLTGCVGLPGQESEGLSDFRDVTEAWGVADRGTVDWGINFVDWDNDGDEDIAVVSGDMLEGGEKETNALYEKLDGRLVDRTRSLGAEVSGAAWADYDNDGDLDWFVVNAATTTLLDLPVNQTIVVAQ